MLRYLTCIFIALLCLTDAARSQCDECVKDEIKGIKAEIRELQKILRTVLRRIGEAKRCRDSKNKFIPQMKCN